MLVAVCERDSSSSDQNQVIVDTEKLQKIADSEHEDKVLAKDYLEAINALYIPFQKGERLWFTSDYTNPDAYAPKDGHYSAVEVEEDGNKFPLTIDFQCEVWIGDE